MYFVRYFVICDIFINTEVNYILRLEIIKDLEILTLKISIKNIVLDIITRYINILKNYSLFIFSTSNKTKKQKIDFIKFL